MFPLSSPQSARTNATFDPSGETAGSMSAIPSGGRVRRWAPVPSAFMTHNFVAPSVRPPTNRQVHPTTPDENTNPEIKSPMPIARAPREELQARVHRDGTEAPVVFTPWILPRGGTAFASNFIAGTAGVWGSGGIRCLLP